MSEYEESANTSVATEVPDTSFVTDKRKRRFEVPDDAVAGDESVRGGYATEETDKYIAAKLQGKTAKELFDPKNEDGFNPERMYSQLRHGSTEEYIRNRLKNLGMGDDVLLGVVRDALGATVHSKKVTVDKDGNTTVTETISATDHAIRLKAATLAFKLNGMLKAPQVNQSGIINNNGPGSVQIDQKILSVTGDDLKKEMLAISRAIQEKRPYDEVRSEVVGEGAIDLSTDTHIDEPA